MLSKRKVTNPLEGHFLNGVDAGIGFACKQLGVDTDKMMEIVKKWTQEYNSPIPPRKEKDK